MAMMLSATGFTVPPDTEAVHSSIGAAPLQSRSKSGSCCTGLLPRWCTHDSSWSSLGLAFRLRLGLGFGFCDHRVEPLLHLLRADVLDPGLDRPNVAERILELSRTIAVELVRQRPLHLGTGRNRAFEHRIGIGDVE